MTATIYSYEYTINPFTNYIFFIQISRHPIHTLFPIFITSISNLVLSVFSNWGFVSFSKIPQLNHHPQNTQIANLGIHKKFKMSLLNIVLLYVLALVGLAGSLNLFYCHTILDRAPNPFIRTAEIETPADAEKEFKRAQQYLSNCMLWFCLFIALLCVCLNQECE